MNFLDLLTGIIPISASLLSVAASVAATVVTKKIAAKDKKISKMSIKWKGTEIEIDDCSEKEIMELITKLKDQEELQKDSTCE